MLVFLDGRVIPKSEAGISVDDRGFLFGDGVYEVTRAINGKLFEEERHWRRLQSSMRGISLRSEFLDAARFRDIANRLLHENDLLKGEATVYLQVTRGAAPRSHAFPKPSVEPTIYAYSNPFTIPTNQRAEGVAAITTPDIRWARCDIKSVNLLPNAMAKQRAVESGAWEALLIRDGVLTEGALTNAFAVIGGEVRTHPKSNYILPGITREIVLELAGELGIPAIETPIFAEELHTVDELFLTGTTTDVQGVVRLDGEAVGDGKVGPITRALNEKLVARMAKLSV